MKTEQRRNRFDKIEWSRVINGVQYHFYINKSYHEDTIHTVIIVYRNPNSIQGMNELIPVHYIDWVVKGGE